MKNYIDGLFYTFYWRNRLYRESAISVVCAIVLIGGLATLDIGAIIILSSILFHDSIVNELLTNLSLALLLMPQLLFPCYYLWNRRYRRIRRKHCLYKNSKVRWCANWYFIISVFFFGSAYIFMVIDACWL